VILKRFFAPDLVFSLGIWLSLGLDALLNWRGDKPRSHRNERKNRHGSPLRPGGSQSRAHT
jgi:hypothetical protein